LRKEDNKNLIDFYYLFYTRAASRLVPAAACGSRGGVAAMPHLTKAALFLIILTMIAIASDHGGLALKAEIKKLLEEKALPYKDFGTNSAESCDYALFGYPAAMAVASGECERGILICGTGVGMSLVANKIRGIRCVVCSDCFTAALSREHNDSNILALGERVVGLGLGRFIASTWLETSFSGGRHARRIAHITQIEEGKAPGLN
jgi:ribose 5-phosphate isomerase B